MTLVSLGLSPATFCMVRLSLLCGGRYLTFACIGERLNSSASRMFLE